MGSKGAMIRLAWVQTVISNGRRYYYFRRPGQPRVRLPGLPGSSDFLAAYDLALANIPQPIGSARTLPGTVNAAVVAYYNSAAYSGLAPSTKKTYRGILERFRLEHGDKRVAMLRPRHLEEMLDDRKGTPAAAKNFLKALRGVLDNAKRKELVSENVALGVHAGRYAEKSHHVWTEEEIAQFEARHPVGTKARLAMTLMLFTGARKSDAVDLGRQHISNEVLRYTPKKTKRRKTVCVMKVHPELRRVIDGTPLAGQMQFLVTEHRQKFSEAGFGNWFKDRCREAGLPHCSSHGLRHAQGRRLAEAGCTEREIMAILGHTTSKQATLYTKGADVERLSASAIDKLTATKPEQPVKKSGTEFTNHRGKDRKQRAG
jgi:integrase